MVKRKDEMTASEAVSVLRGISRSFKAFKLLESLDEALDVAAKADRLAKVYEKQVDDIQKKIKDEEQNLSDMRRKGEQEFIVIKAKAEDAIADAKEQIAVIEKEKDQKRQAALKEQEDINEAVRSLRAHYASEEQKTKEMLAAFNSQIEQKKQELQQVKDQMHKLATGLSSVA